MRMCFLSLRLVAATRMAGEPPRSLQPQTAASSPAELKYLQIFTFITNVFANISFKILFDIKYVDRDHDHDRD